MLIAPDINANKWKTSRTDKRLNALIRHSSTPAWTLREGNQYYPPLSRGNSERLVELIFAIVLSNFIKLASRSVMQSLTGLHRSGKKNVFMKALYFCFFLFALLLLLLFLVFVSFYWKFKWKWKKRLIHILCHRKGHRGHIKTDFKILFMLCSGIGLNSGEKNITHDLTTCFVFVCVCFTFYLYHLKNKYSFFNSILCINV